MQLRYTRQRMWDHLRIRSRLLLTGKYLGIAAILLLFVVVVVPLAISLLVAASNNAAFIPNSNAFTDADAVVIAGIEEWDNLTGQQISQLLDKQIAAVEDAPRRVPILVGGLSPDSRYDQHVYLERELRQYSSQHEITHLTEIHTWSDMCRQLSSRQYQHPVLIDFGESALPRVVVCQVLGVSLVSRTLETPREYQQFFLTRAYGLLGSVLRVHLQ